MALPGACGTRREVSGATAGGLQDPTSQTPRLEVTHTQEGMTPETAWPGHMVMGAQTAKTHQENCLGLSGLGPGRTFSTEKSAAGVLVLPGYTVLSENPSVCVMGRRQRTQRSVQLYRPPPPPNEVAHSEIHGDTLDMYIQPSRALHTYLHQSHTDPPLTCLRSRTHNAAVTH